MTGYAVAARSVARQAAAGLYRRLRTAHPVTVLEWLRNGLLLCVLAAALMYVWVATAAGNDIAAAVRTKQAATDIDHAISAAKRADKDLGDGFFTEDVTLIGTGSAFVGDITEVEKDLTLAAAGSTAGSEATGKIQFIVDTLATYLQLSENAVRDYSAGPAFGQVAEGYASGTDTEIVSSLKDLKQTEAKALDAQRGAWPLDPEAFWWVLLGPAMGMALLTTATAHVLAHHFRRHIGRWLWGSLLVTAATAITVGIFNSSDEWHLSADPWAGHPATLTIALVLFLLAAMLAYLGYRPRLAEYRFESS